MDRDLERRARTWGVDVGYHDYRERWRDAPEDTVGAILDLLARDGAESPPASAVRVIAADERVPLQGSLTLESGEVVECDPSEPPRLPLGYHDLETDDGVTRLIVTPARCFLPADARAWGWAIQLYRLWSRASWGIGDLRDLAEFARWSAGRGAGFVMINPLHAASPSPDPEPSPYFPSSRIFRNPLYLAVEDVPGARGAGVDLEELAAAGRALNVGEGIDRAAVQRVKSRALETLWRRRRDDADFDRFRGERGPSLRDFATFIALGELHGPSFKAWPQELQDKDSAAVERFRADAADRIRFHEWIQWLLDGQVAAASREVALIHDLAVGVDSAGADAWIWGDVFAPGVRVGAPADEFNTQGQEWGVLAFDPWRLRAARYEPFIQTVRGSFRYAGGLRIDHVMGLWRLFWVLENTTPADGTYVHYPADDLLGIVALESHRAGALVIGEDLGTVESEVREEMKRRDMLSYRIVWFEEQEPADYPELALAAVANHDIQTIAGLWTGEDVAIQKELGMVPDEDAEVALRERVKQMTGLDDNASSADATRALYARLAQARSVMLAATLEDALEEKRRPNYPGTRVPTNWSLPLPLPREEIEENPLVLDIARVLGTARPRGPAR